jgi:hypothetical protein
MFPFGFWVPLDLLAGSNWHRACIMSPMPAISIFRHLDLAPHFKCDALQCVAIEEGGGTRFHFVTGPLIF